MKLCSFCGHGFGANGWDCPSCGKSPHKKNGIMMFAPSLEESGVNYDPDYFNKLFAIEPGHFWFTSRNGLIMWALRKYCPSAGSFFEAGCGTGFVLAGVGRAFGGMRLAGADMFSECLMLAGQRSPGAELCQMDARNVPFKNEFDCAGCFDTLEHIAEDETVISEIHKALKPGGVFVATVPQHPFLWSAADRSARHLRRYTRKELAGKMTAAGFRVERVTSFVSLLFPALLVSRAFRKKHAAGKSGGYEFDVRPFMNKALSAVMSAERRLISAGVSFPAGGSLLAVARKPA